MRGKNLSDFKEKVKQIEDAALGPYKPFIDPALETAKKIERENIDKTRLNEELELDNENIK